MPTQYSANGCALHSRVVIGYQGLVLNVDSSGIFLPTVASPRGDLRYSPPSTQVLLISPRKLVFLYMVVYLVVCHTSIDWLHLLRRWLLKNFFVLKFSIDPVVVGRGQFYPRYPQIAFGNQMPTQFSATDAPSTAG